MGLASHPSLYPNYMHFPCLLSDIWHLGGLYKNGLIFLVRFLKALVTWTILMSNIKIYLFKCFIFLLMEYKSTLTFIYKYWPIVPSNHFVVYSISIQYKIKRYLNKCNETIIFLSKYCCCFFQISSNIHELRFSIHMMIILITFFRNILLSF